MNHNVIERVDRVEAARGLAAAYVFVAHTLIGNLNPRDNFLSVLLLRFGQEGMQRFAGLLESELRQRGLEVRLLRREPWLIRLVGAKTDPHQGLAKWLGYLLPMS